MNKGNIGHMMILLAPGIAAQAKREGAEFKWHGFVPVIKTKRGIYELSIPRLVRFFNDDDFDGMTDYVSSVISPLIEIS